MPESEEQERRRIKEVLKRDALETRSELGSRIRDTLSRPVNLLFVAFGAMLVFIIDYAAERAIDALIGNDPPQVVQLSDELQSAGVELRQSASEIRALVAELDPASISDEQLRKQFEDLQLRLAGLTDIVQRASQQTDKVAAISEALREDWERNRQRGEGRSDGVPDLVLGTGEAISVCRGLASIGVIRVTGNDGTAHLKANDWTYWVSPGQRVPLDGGAGVVFMGLTDGNARLGVECPG